MAGGKKKIIAFMLPSLVAGGAERVFVNLLKKFDRSRFYLHLIVVDPTGPYLKIVPDDIAFHGLGYKKVSRAIPEMANTIRKINPDIILSTLDHLNLALLLIKPFLPSKTRLLLRECNLTSRNLANGYKNLVFRVLKKRLLNYADRIICPANAIKKDLQINFGIRPDKMITIYNPVLAEEIRSHLQPDHPDKHRSVYKIVSAGTLEHRKGFDLLINAMSKIVRENQKVHLTLLGDGPEKENLRNQINSLNLSGYVRLEGYQKNPFIYFSTADLFVLSSRYEGLPNAVLESLACGTPVVAFNCPGGVDEIIVNESQGALVPENDIQALSKAIEKQMRSHKHTKGSLLPEKFDVKAIVPAYEELALSV
ncbi:MAG: glycosyltransferase [Desulfobacterales bacterium]|jgi:glycosyltransferase involved in cell wall biosynthesis